LQDNPQVGDLAEVKVIACEAPSLASANHSATKETASMTNAATPADAPADAPTVKPAAAPAVTPADAPVYHGPHWHDDWEHVRDNDNLLRGRALQLCEDDGGDDHTLPESPAHAEYDNTCVASESVTKHRRAKRAHLIWSTALQASLLCKSSDHPYCANLCDLREHILRKRLRFLVRGFKRHYYPSGTHCAPYGGPWCIISTPVAPNTPNGQIQRIFGHLLILAPAGWHHRRASWELQAPPSQP